MYTTADAVRVALDPTFVPGSPEPSRAATNAGYLTDDQLDQCITWACGRIDTYLAARYKTPIEDVPSSTMAPFEAYATDLAAWRATLTFFGNTELSAQHPVQLAYAAAMTDLAAIAAGKLVLKLPGALDDDADAQSGYAGVVDPGTGGIFDRFDLGVRPLRPTVGNLSGYGTYVEGYGWVDA